MPQPLRDSLPYLRDIPAAFGLLTRLPVPFTAPRPQGAWAWPLVGLVVAAVAACAGALALWAGVTAGVAAVLVMTVQAVLTGGLHEDGLADCADGFFGGHDRARRLEIMKDSQIGSFGALALMLAMLARWAALSVLLASGAWGVILAAGVLSRAPMAVVQMALPNARGSGLSAMVGGPSLAVALMACGFAGAVAVMLVGWLGLVMGFAAACVGLGVALVARAKIGGQTGDVLGATAVLAEVFALAVAA